MGVSLGDTNSESGEITPPLNDEILFFSQVSSLTRIREGDTHFAENRECYFSFSAKIRSSTPDILKQFSPNHYRGHSSTAQRILAVLSSFLFRFFAINPLFRNVKVQRIFMLSSYFSIVPDILLWMICVLI